MTDVSTALAFGVDLTDVRDRLDALSYFVVVEDLRAASEILAADDGFGFVPPAAFVSVASESADRDRMIRGAGGHAQRVNVTLSVLFAESDARADRKGDDQVEETRKAIIRQLIFWTPNRAAAALQYDRYLLRASGNGLVWGEVLFRTSYRLSV